jgi:hypothetical protein
VIARTDLFILVVVLFLALLVGVAVYYLLRMHKASKATWSSLLERLVAVDRNRIAVVALDLVDESGRPREGGQPEIEPDSLWDLVGGMDGLEALEKNCEVLIDLAFYVQQQHPEALVVTEQLRLNAREIQWHVARLKGAAQTGNLASSFPLYAQRAVATYYLMTRHLLELYQRGNLSEFGQLQAVL